MSRRLRRVLASIRRPYRRSGFGFYPRRSP